MRRRTKRILAGIGIIVAALGTMYAAALTRSTARLREAYATLERDGRPMNAADVTPKKVSNEQNAAVLYRKAAAMLKSQPAGGKDLLKQIATLAGAPFKETDDPEKLARQKQEVAELKQLMGQDAVSQAISVVEQGTHRPACQFFDGNADHGLSLEAPGMEDLRDLIHVMGTKVHFEAEAGRPQKAWDMIPILLRFADGPRNEPSVTSQFARTGMINYSCGTIQTLCETAPPDDENYRQIEGLLAGMDDVGPLVRAVDAERLLLGEWLFNLPDDELFEMLRKNPWGMEDTQPGLAYRLTFRFVTFRPRFIADHAAYLQIMGKSTQLLQSPYVPRESQEYKEIERLIGHNFVSDRLAPMVWGIQWFHCRTAAAVRMTLAGLAVLRYKQARGTWPPSLDALDLKNVTDPFSGQPLHYRAKDDGFLVYSVGDDQKDDGGIAEPVERRGSRDMVWRFPEPKAG
jgi:hypothetical protein